MNGLVDQITLAVLVGLPVLFGIFWLAAHPNTIAAGGGAFEFVKGLFVKGPESAAAKRLRLLDEARDLHDSGPMDSRPDMKVVIMALLESDQPKPITPPPTAGVKS